MRILAWAWVAMVAAGCSVGPFAATCPSNDVIKPANGTLVHVDVLNDGRYSGRVCVQVGGRVHTVDLHARSMVPDVTRVLDDRVEGTQVRLNAWFAGSDAIFHDEQANATTETWYTLVTSASSIQIRAHHEPPAYD